MKYNMLAAARIITILIALVATATVVTAAAQWHDYPDNYSNGQSVNGIGDMFSYINFVGGKEVGGLLLIAISSIGFFSMKSSGQPASKIFTAISYVSTILATSLMMMGLVAFYIPMILAIVTIIVGISARNEANMGL